MARQRLGQTLKVRLVELGEREGWALLMVGQMAQMGFEPGQIVIVVVRAGQTRLVLGLLWTADQILMGLLAVAVEPLVRMGS